MRIAISTLFFLLLSVSATAQADNFKSFEWDIIRIGYAVPGLDAFGSGLAISTEPRINIKDNLSAGLRVEFALFAAGNDNGGSVGASGSYTLMGDYYFNDTNTSRAFAGLGLGYFGGASVEFDDPNGPDAEADGGGTIGIVPRVGYELGHLRLSAEYNLAFKEAVPNYIGIHLGITIGGGAK